MVQPRVSPGTRQHRVLLVAPVTLAIASELEIPPYPLLFAEIFASNIGGTATLIGPSATLNAGER